ERVQLAALFQTFDGGDGLARALAHRGDARPGGPALEDDRTGAAAALAAAVLAAGQVQVVPQDAEQAPLRVGLDAVFDPIYLQFDRGHRLLLEGRLSKCGMRSAESQAGNGGPLLHSAFRISNKPGRRLRDSPRRSAPGPRRSRRAAIFPNFFVKPARLCL